MDLVSIPIMDAEVMVELMKTGGIFGVNQELKLSEHSGTLTVEDDATLRRQLGDVDFFEITGDGSGSTPYNGFNYTICAAHGRRYRRIAAEEWLGEKTLARLWPLISWLEAKLPDTRPELVLDWRLRSSKHPTCAPALACTYRPEFLCGARFPARVPMICFG